MTGLGAWAAATPAPARVRAAASAVARAGSRLVRCIVLLWVEDGSCPSHPSPRAAAATRSGPDRKRPLRPSGARLGERQAEAHAGPALGIREPDAAAVGLDDRAGDGEPEAGPVARSRRVGAAAVEGGEHPRPVAVGDAAAGVGDL